MIGDPANLDPGTLVVCVETSLRDADLDRFSGIAQWISSSGSYGLPTRIYVTERCLSLAYLADSQLRRRPDLDYIV